MTSAPAPSANSAESVWSPRADVSLVMGSTRVGVSTTAAVLAVVAARQGLDVLLVATDRSPAVEILLGGTELDGREHTVFRAGGSVRVGRIPTGQVFSDHLQQGGLGGMFRRALSGSSLPLIEAAVPGLRDLLTLTGVLDRAGRQDVDAILVDTPSNGRSFEFLHSVEDASAVVQSPRLLESAVAVQSAFEDPTRFEGVPVLVGEYDDASLTAALIDRVRSLKALAVRDAVVNQVDRPGDEQRALVGRLGDEAAVRPLRLPLMTDGVTTVGDIHELAARLEQWS